MGNPAMPATIRIAAPILVSLWAGSSFAQSTVTLESFDLDETPREAFEAPNTRPAGNCLLNPDADGCGTIDRSTRTFSLNDVVNLGIIERDEVERKDVNGRVVTVEERVEPLPSIDLEILFDYNSANLRPDQMAPLIALSRDLAEIDFTRAQLVLMGHTDGVGSAAYNRELSHRRAQSVAAFLAQAADIPIYRIKASGMGFDYLKYPSDPRNAANRRVQVLLVE
jgi:outer membrane protein OmpA-like peptidoglycan-associated protein